MLYTQFKTAPIAAGLAIAVGLTALPLADNAAMAQTSYALSAPRTSNLVDANIHMDRAKSLATAGQFAAARDEYARAAEVLRTEGVLPTEAVWQIAQIYHSEGNFRKAAEVLSGLAKEAEISGDPNVMARALLEASVLYQEVGMTDQMLRSARRLQQLRSSPFLTDELRAAINSRVSHS